MSAIEWTEKTWNPVRGCSRVSPGCDNCYAMRQAHRFAGAEKPYEGLTTLRRGKVDWSGRVRFVPALLDLPLRRRRPTTWFVNSMSDLFHESLTDEEIAAVFGVMAACHWHTFQVLTKRPWRMRKWFELASLRGCLRAALDIVPVFAGWHLGAWDGDGWPLPNVWLGVSCEDQARADDRIPILLATPAAVRFVSAEPLLGPLALGAWLRRHAVTEHDDCAPWCSACGPTGPLPGIDWVIVGGESGAKARPCHVDWIRSVVEQCQKVKVPVFVKQLGAHVVDDPSRVEKPDGIREDYQGAPVRVRLRDRKGADPSEWTEPLRVREKPETKWQ